MPRRRRGWTQLNNIDSLEHHSPLTTSLLEPVLLFLLQRKESHGYSLLPELEAMQMGTIHPGVVYRTLRDLEELGWIESQWEMNQTQGPPRRIYKVTPDGKQALSTWKKDLVKTKEIIEQVLEGSTN